MRLFNPSIPAEPKKDTYPNSVDPDEPSHLDLYYFLFLNHLFATLEMSKFSDGRVHFINLRVKGLIWYISKIVISLQSQTVFAIHKYILQYPMIL